MSTAPSNWYPDPMKRHQLRFWDGSVWTHHVSNNGVTGIDPLDSTRLDRFEQGLTVGNEGDPEKITRQVSGTGYRGADIQNAAFEGAGTLFTEPILVASAEFR